MAGPDNIDRAACVLVALGSIPILFIVAAVVFAILSALGVL